MEEGGAKPGRGNHSMPDLHLMRFCSSGILTASIAIPTDKVFVNNSAKKIRTSGASRVLHINQIVYAPMGFISISENLHPEGIPPVGCYITTYSVRFQINFPKKRIPKP